MSNVSIIPTHELHRRAAELLETGTIGEAIEAHERLLEAAPEQADSWYNLAFLQRRAGRLEEALASYQQALDRGVDTPREVYLNRGAIYADNLARGEEAEAEFRAALVIDPDYVEAGLNLGNVLEDRGDREGASAAYQNVLATDPSNALALSRLANLSDFASADDPLITRVYTAVAASRSATDRADLGFALGRALDAAGAYDQAFAAYAAANRANSEGARRYDPAANEAFIDRLIRAFPTPVERASSGRARPPIFICGMFRSGSTLAERILGAHSRVTTGGELPLIPRLVRNGPQPYPDAFAAASPETIGSLRDAYLEGLAALHPVADIVTDKRPDNFLHVGMIKALFPDARIVNTIRDPLDNCLAVWFLQLNPAMTYASDLESIAHWRGQYLRLMAHWKALYPDDIHDVDYDALVADPRPPMERLLDFCGLEWEDAVMSFHETDGPVRTASTWQVREPLYRRSSGRWRNYERHLQVLRDTLGGSAG